MLKYLHFRSSNLHFLNIPLESWSTSRETFNAEKHFLSEKPTLNVLLLRD